MDERRTPPDDPRTPLKQMIPGGGDAAGVSTIRRVEQTVHVKDRAGSDQRFRNTMEYIMSNEGNEDEDGLLPVFTQGVVDLSSEDDDDDDDDDEDDDDDAGAGQGRGVAVVGAGAGANAGGRRQSHGDGGANLEFGHDDDESDVSFESDGEDDSMATTPHGNGASRNRKRSAPQSPATPKALSSDVANMSISSPATPQLDLNLSYIQNMEDSPSLRYSLKADEQPALQRVASHPPNAQPRRRHHHHHHHHCKPGEEVEEVEEEEEGEMIPDEGENGNGEQETEVNRPSFHSTSPPI